MTIKVHFYAGLREIFGTKETEVRVENGADIRALLNLVCDSPRRRAEIFAGDKLKPLMIILKNGRHIQHLDGLETRLEAGDDVSVFPAVAGG